MLRSTASRWLVVLAAMVAIGWSAQRQRAVMPDVSGISRLPYDAGLLDRTIAVFEERLHRDPGNPLDLNLLASQYLERCRQSGDVADAQRAEACTRQSVARHIARNHTAVMLLARALLSQHRFPEALQQAVAATDAEPDAAGPARLRAEILLELGDYDEATRWLRRASAEANTPAGRAVRARSIELHGYPGQALGLLRSACAEVDGQHDTSRELTAWFHQRVGDLEAELNRPREAEKAYREALWLWPRDHHSLTGMARLAAGRGDWHEVLRWGERSAAIVPAPEVVALVADADTALGRAREAAGQVSVLDAMAQLSRAGGSVYDRQRAVYDCDHDRNLPEALRLARAELTVRRDLLAWDTLAWACYKNGLLAEAQDATERARALPLRDAGVMFHAGMIAAARGDRERAADCLRKALVWNANFSRRLARQAEDRLRELGRG